MTTATNKYLVFLFLCIFFLIAKGQVYVYVCDSTGNDSNDCSFNAPCKTIAKALSTLEFPSTAIIGMCPGVYTGNENINVQLQPNYPTQIQKSNDSETGWITFDCQFQFQQVFSTTTSLYLSDIEIKNCNVGIFLFSDLLSPTLQLDQVQMDNCTQGIYFDAPNAASLEIQKSSFNNGEISITTTEIYSLQIETTTFSNYSEFSLQLQSSNFGHVYIQDCQFLNTAGINVASSQNYLGLLRDCFFSNFIISSSQNSVISCTQGRWEFESIQIQSSQCTTGLSFYDVDSSIEKVNISSCETGIDVYNNKRGIYFRYSDSWIDSSSTCISYFGDDLIKLNHLNLQNCKQNSISIINSNFPLSLELSNVVFNNTASASFSMASESNCILNQCDFLEQIDSFLKINGGNWSLTNLHLIPNSKSNSENIMYFDSMNSSLSSISITNSLFVNNDYIGRFIYANDVLLSIFNSSFDQFNSNGNGSVLYLNSSNTQISSSSFSNSFTSQNGASIFATNSNLFVNNSIFSQNSANLNGAAILIDTFDVFNITFTNFTLNKAELYGGGISLLNTFSSRSSNAYVNQCQFLNNNASSGSAISCCYNNSDSCNVSVFYYSEDSNNFENNNNYDTNGADVTCVIFLENYTPSNNTDNTDGDGGNEESSVDDWVYWLLVALVGLVGIILILGVVMVVVIIPAYRRRAYQNF